MPDYPRIKSRRVIDVSPWMHLIEREVEFTEGGRSELYHAIGQQDYVAVVALTPDGKIPIVRQYRPALERFTWELPAGMTDAGEAAIDCARRELEEETGFPARAAHELGTYAPCTARLSNWVHSFFVEAGPRVESRQTEPDIALELVTPAALGDLIRSGEFVLQLHIGALFLAGLRGYIDLQQFGPSQKGAARG